MASSTNPHSLRADDSCPTRQGAGHRALRLGLLTLHGLLLVISSPHRKLGILYGAHRKYFGNDAATRGLYIQASSRDLNPGIDEQDIAEAMEDDAAAAQSEYLGHFRDDLQGFLDDATVDGAIVPGRRMLPRGLGCKYLAFADPSGGRGDSFTLAIAHQEPAPPGTQAGRVVLDVLEAVAPPFDPETVVSGMAETLKGYGLREVSGDQYAGEWVPAAFQRYGISYKAKQRVDPVRDLFGGTATIQPGPYRVARPAGVAHAIAAAGAAHSCGRQRQRRPSTWCA